MDLFFNITLQYVTIGKSGYAVGRTYIVINPLIKGTVSTWVALSFIYTKYTVLCHLETIYYERRDSAFFCTQNFKFWSIAGQILTEIVPKNCPNS